MPENLVPNLTERIEHLTHDVESLKEDNKYLQDLFYDNEYDSDTHWIKIGIPPEWCDDEDEDE